MFGWDRRIEVGSEAASAGLAAGMMVGCNGGALYTGWRDRRQVDKARPRDGGVQTGQDDLMESMGDGNCLCRTGVVFFFFSLSRSQAAPKHVKHLTPGNERNLVVCEAPGSAVSTIILGKGRQKGRTRLGAFNPTSTNDASELSGPRVVPGRQASPASSERCPLANMGRAPLLLPRDVRGPCLY